ncbi:MAG: proton-conducting transporter transmembrane domain-containing protein [Phycisphaerales bacterium]
MPLDLTIIAILLAAASGCPALCLARSSAAGQRLAAFLMLLAAAAGLTAAFASLTGAPGGTFSFPWPSGNGPLALDPLSAFFLVPVFLMGTLGSIFGLRYWPQPKHPANARKLQLFWGLLIAGMSLLLIARHGIVFLLGWEIMALAAFFLVATEDHLPRCRDAGWIYLIATHIGTLTLFALFSLWHHATGSFILQPPDAPLSPGTINVLFLLTLLGFGLKAGIMPLHFWLPGAHANAPSHVSAILSGVVLKMGIYGLLRILMLLPTPPAAYASLILILGAISGLLGVVFAIAQHDLKRLLAYHSVENIGIILMGLGLALLGRAHHQPALIALGLAGCLLHVWNHALFKSLLFLAAGSVVHATHTRQIDHLGGLAKSMPHTAALFLLAAVAITGLPPLNGFISELLIYLGLLRPALSSENISSAVMLIAPVLAMIGALALACFVKVTGAVFLGMPRTHAACSSPPPPGEVGWGYAQPRQMPVHERDDELPRPPLQLPPPGGEKNPRPSSNPIHDPPFSMLAPMLILAACCLLIGIAPVLVAPLLDTVIACWSPEPATPIAQLVPLQTISILAVALLVLIAFIWKLLPRTKTLPGAGALLPGAGAGTWDCGYARPTRRIQYTASSFAQTIVALFRWVLRPRTHLPRITGLFPTTSQFSSHVDDAVLDRALLPSGRNITRAFAWFHRFQQGLTQQYVLYILITVIIMLGSLIPAHAFFARLFAR